MHNPEAACQQQRKELAAAEAEDHLHRKHWVWIDGKLMTFSLNGGMLDALRRQYRRKPGGEGRIRAVPVEGGGP